MKKLFTENIGLKLGSVVIAIILWILVVYTYDPAATTNFKIGVDIINGESIASSGKVYEVIEGDTITIRVKANASLIKNLKATDFKATADVSKLSPTYHANIDVVCTKSDNVEITIIGNAKMLAVKLEDLVTKQFPVTIEKSGEPETGYYVGETIASPNLISVSGGKKSVEKISVVRVKADVNGANDLFYADGIPKAYDADGNEITTGSLKFSDNPVKVAVSVYKTKNVSIIVKAVGEPYKGYFVQDINYEPKSVTVAGPDSVLSKLNSIKLPLNVEGEITDIEVSINLSDYIKEGLYLVDKDVLVNAKCNIVRLGTKEFELLPTDISLTNKSDKFNYELIDSEKIKVTITGLSEKLKNIEISDLAPYVDLSNAKEVGDYSYMVKFKENDGVKVESTKAVTVRVSAINSNPINTVSDGAIDTASGSAVDTDENPDESENNNSGNGSKETKPDSRNE
ncbi:YbbR-like protein [Catonella morbi ATCC 51271]|uniref:YbbR-like protein n=1 Tax=Catonella morbi ATCC 51271 TaxID=592026 RepID=V2Y9A1_9FIRM|nr:CdaR family protein [Catonella morbi]ESL04677.1 YbbR-like protein [Catonella morbi ATCC 51271]